MGIELLDTLDLTLEDEFAPAVLAGERVSIRQLRQWLADLS